MIEEKVRINIPSVKQKFQKEFPNDSKADIAIIYKNKTFKLQKAYLRLESKYFSKVITKELTSLEIKEPFNADQFENVLKCFYGYTVEFEKAQILEYFTIITFLEIDCLLNALRNDIINSTQQYDIFILMQLAHMYTEQQIFQKCLILLEKDAYEQIRINKNELLKCPLELFKIIVKTHNRFKSERGFGIPYIEIDSVIKEISEELKLSEGEYKDLKFELIDKKSLTSHQYKEIYLDDPKIKKSAAETTGNYHNGAESMMQSTYANKLNNTGKLTESIIDPLNATNEDLALEMENEFEKKKNEELQLENNFLMNELNELKEKTHLSNKNYEELKEVVVKLQRQLDEKEKSDREQNNIIKGLEKVCRQLKNQLNEKGQFIKKLEEKVAKLEKAKGKGKLSKEEDTLNVQSQILPAHLLKEMTKPTSEKSAVDASKQFKKEKSEPISQYSQAATQQLDEELIEEMYMSRLSFDQEPTGCPKRYLPRLADFLTTQGFQKKKLDLIFKRSLTSASLGKIEDIRNKFALLFIVCTKLNEVIGGYTAISISNNSCDYLADENAFIFSASKNQKFPIKKTAINEAIFISNNYLFCFSNDLMISSECLKNQSQCQWPEAYEGGSEKRSSKWLTGEEGAFSIKSVQVYEVTQQQMVMDL